MAYFSSGVTRDKLIVLYFLQKIDFELTREQVYQVMALNDWMNYFDFQTTMLELEEDGYIAAIPRSFGQGYRPTQLGREAISLFENTLPYSLREAMSSYVEEHMEELRLETQFQCDIQPWEEGGYTVQLKAMDRNAILFQISAILPNQEVAQRACKNWRTEAAALYQITLEHLTK